MMGGSVIGKTLILLVAICCLFWIAETRDNAAAARRISVVPSQNPLPTPRPISNGALPVVSPDGNYIAFTSDRGGTPDLYVIHPDGTGELQLTHTPDPEGNIAWTRNGRQILFSTFKDDVGRLYTIDVDGKNQREIANVPGRAPTLSPDGKRLLYMAGTWTATKLTVANVDGSNAKQIIDDTSIAWNSHWSPNGRQIAFTSRTDPKSELAVYLMNADGSSRHQLTHVPAEEGGAQGPQWAADGKQLAFQVNNRTRQGSAHVWIINLGSGATRKLAAHEDSYLDETPSWFPDGKRIAFQSNRTGRMEVWIMNIDGSEMRQVTGVPPVTLAGDPRVSPDGKSILFISNRTGVYQIYSMKADGSKVRQLTRGSRGSFLGNWSPDGHTIVYYTTEPTKKIEQIVVMNADGSGNRVITETKGDQLPGWSPDGAQILFAGGTFPNINIFTISADGSGRRNISPNPGFDYDPTWSPDGKTIALVTAVRGQGPRVWLMNADGTNRRRVTSSNEAEERPSWSRDGRYLAFQSAMRGSAPRHAYIHVVEVATGTDRRLGTHDRPLLDETPNWFPDGKRIAFQSNRTGVYEIWVMSVDGTAARRIAK